MPKVKKVEKVEEVVDVVKEPKEVSNAIVDTRPHRRKGEQVMGLLFKRQQPRKPDG